MRLRGGTFLSTPSPCLRASVFFVFKRRRHKKRLSAAGTRSYYLIKTLRTTFVSYT